ncbi:MAG: hypothetical protein Q7S71_04190 [Candidatus Nitrotoga sp.]|nr:hypothetical protein [Candidatus Nitrotoga sp.]
MHGGYALAFVAPLEGAVREADADALREHVAPQHGNLLALGDAVGGDECDINPDCPLEKFEEQCAGGF